MRVVIGNMNKNNHLTFFNIWNCFSSYKMIIFNYNKIRDMKKIKEMIETAPTKSMAMQMLETYRIFGDITETQYQKGRALIRKEF